MRGTVGSDGIGIWRGIPYAAPPIGDLRWRPPLPRAPWKTVFNATSDGAGCPQLCALPAATCPPKMSEDCLHLNVFSPGNRRGGNGLKNVMFFIHGGDFIQGYGGGPLYDGTSFVRDHDVVVVSANYRLGALGFMRTGDDDSKGQFAGNFGLLDQRLALEWARANVARFGGNPQAVTLFGQSAGGMSVASHLTMPASAHLFHRAIIQSDPLALPFRTADEWPKFARVVARKAKCVHGLLDQNYEACMRSLPWKDVVQAQHDAKHDLFVELGHLFDLFCPYSPAIGTDVLATQPLQAIEAGKMQDKPIIIGTVAQEGLLFGWQAFHKPESSLVEDALLEAGFGVTKGPRILKQYPRSSAAKQAHDMRNHTGLVATDGLFHCPARHGALALAAQRASKERKSDTWHYHFGHVASFSKQMWLPLFPECVDAVCHSEELPFLFLANSSLAFINASFTAPEEALAHTLQAYWGHFANFGSPAEKDSEWPPFDETNEPMMHFTADPASGVDHAAWRTKCSFWDDLGYTPPPTAQI